MFGIFSTVKQALLGKEKKLSSKQKMLLISVLGIAALCYLEVEITTDMADMAYRLTWLVLAGAVLAVLYYANHNRRELDVRRCLLIVMLITGQIFLNYGIIYLSSQISLPAQGDVEGSVSYGQMLLVIPYAFAPIIVSAMLGRKLGVFTAVCTGTLGLAVMPMECGATILLNYLVISLLAGFTGALMCNHVQRNDRVPTSGASTGAVVFISALALGCCRDNGLLSIQNGFHFSAFALEALAALVSSSVFGVLAGGLIPVIEKRFKIYTHIKWLEWKDMNNPLLRKLQHNAPGTFHHSIEVQRLAEAAAQELRVDDTLTSVCALYHDIGKLRRPEYFSENIPNQKNSPHSDLTPEASARIILQHVQDGIEIAREYKLNTRIIDVIREHHGVSTAYFFYRKAVDLYNAEKKKYDDGLIDTCPEEPNIEDFTYKGPVPQTKESGIVSMADAVESACRSIVDPSDDDLRDMINGIFKGRIADWHLQYSQLTLGEIARMKESFFNTLHNMRHTRIAYPKPKEEGEAIINGKAIMQRESAKSEPS